jgi:glycine/D-amino acid oxidase-like deaminating enzyme
MIYDFTIVGGGILGVMCAYFLRKRFPGGSICILEKSSIASGCTKYSVGLNYPYGKNIKRKALTKRSNKLWEKIQSEVNTISFNDIELYGIVRKRHLLSTLNGFTDPSIKCINNDIQLDFSFSLPDGYKVLGPINCNFCDTYYNTVRLANYLQLQNIEIKENTIFKKLEKQEPHIKLYSPNAIFTCKNVIFSLGPWTNHILNKNILDTHHIRTKKVVCLYINYPVRMTSKGLFFFEEDSFLLPNYQEQRWFFSITVEEWDCDPESDDFVISKDDLVLAKKILKKYLPGMEGRLMGGRVFCDLYGPNRIPFIMNHPGFKNTKIISGGSGSGFRLAPALADKCIKSFGR